MRCWISTIMPPMRPQPDRSERDPVIRDAMSAAEQAELRFRTFVHELAGLVDGSLRSVQLAQRRLARSERGLPEEAHVAITTAEHGLSSIAELIHEVRESYLAAGPSIAPRTSPTRVVDAIEDAAELVRHVAADRGVQIRTDFERAVFAVPPVPLFPVLQNGLRNAVEACRPGGLVVMRATQQISPDRLVIEIIDEGHGLPDASGHSPFERGFTTKPGGMGIGLALCEEIVHALGGNVTLRNREDHTQGCVFTVTVPLSEHGSGVAA